MSSFELNAIDNYTVQNWEENDFINNKNSEADLAKYGKTYSVQFEGNAETYLWTTKSQPERKSTYYGHIQATSGKMQRFKLDKQEDVLQPSQSTPTNVTGQSTDESIARAVALKAAVEIVAASGEKLFIDDTVLGVADRFLAWLQNTGTSVEGISAPLTSNEEKSHPASDSKRDWSKLANKVFAEEPDPEWSGERFIDHQEQEEYNGEV